MVKAVLLDAYGTLFDTGTGSVQAAQEILARNGREDLSPAEFYGQWKALHHRLMEELPSFRTEARLYAQGLAMLYRQYGFSRNPAEDVKVMLRYQGTRTAYPEVKAVVESLTPQYLLCVASTTDTAPLLRDLARAGLRFQHVFTSEALGAYKPSPAFYQPILRALALSPKETVFVGDSLKDGDAGYLGQSKIASRGECVPGCHRILLGGAARCPRGMEGNIDTISQRGKGCGSRFPEPQPFCLIHPETWP